MMKESYLRYYKSQSRIATWRFKLDSLFARSPTQKDGLSNRSVDYRTIKDNEQLRNLHFNLNKVLQEQSTNWDSHDYGEGYFYQSLDEICVSGLRDTSARIAALNMSQHVSGRTVLDIGSNTGFMSIGLAKSAKSVEGIESNPYLNKIGYMTAEYLGLQNLKFNDTSFEDFRSKHRYDVVTSFANHSTYDGNTQHTIQEYVAKCHSLINKDGLLLFESHAPAYEGSKLDDVLNLFKQRFNILESLILKTGKRFDDGRTLFIADPK